MAALKTWNRIPGLHGYGFDENRIAGRKKKLSQAKAVVEDDYAELKRNVKQIICFVYTTFGNFPLDLHCYMPLIGAH